jgi:4-alpha-glucanotransferase
VDFERLVPAKQRALRTAFDAFNGSGENESTSRFAGFREAEAGWLDDYALFAAVHEREGTAWMDWPAALRSRDPKALQATRLELASDVAFHAFTQYLFFQQWQAVRHQAQALDVRIMGDIPIFVALDSADVWANQHLFKLDETGQPVVVAGVPPDYFSETGQLWGNPLYDWEAMARDGYAWWAHRFEQLLRLVDVVRIDHFRGFQSAGEVPAGEPTAVHGQWVEGPGAAFFQAIDRALRRDVPVVAEDLGLITDEVRALLAELQFPGMKVLQFAFGGDADHLYLPHMFESPNWVIYTGTHDNDTTRGWYEHASEREQDAVRRYTHASGDDVTWDCIRLAEASVADVAIIPLQDVLDLGSGARMNTPGAAEGNWEWRVLADDLRPDLAHRLRDLTRLYGRSGVHHQ